MAKQPEVKKTTAPDKKLLKNQNQSGEKIMLSIIIVNFNVKDFLEQALLSIKKAIKGIESEIIVVDNASSDGSTALIKQRFPDVNLIENSENLGFARGSNQGLKAARGEYLVLLNPDTIVQEDTFAKMLKFYQQNPDTGMLGCKILNPDGSLQLACRRSFPTPWVAFTKLSGLSHLFPGSKLFGKYNLTYLDPDSICEVDAISGSIMMIPRKVLQEVGYLDESFFLYGEDLDWCYRIQEKGWKVKYFPETKIIHFKGESSKRTQFDNLKVFYQAMSRFVRKHFKQKYLLMPYWLLWIAIWIRAGFSIIKKVFHFVAVPFSDFLFLSLSLILGIYFRFGNFDKVGYFIPVILTCNLIWMGMLYYFGCYGKHKYSSSKAGFAIMVGFLINASLFFFFKQYAYSRFVVLFGGFFSLASVTGWRLFVKLLPRTGLGAFKGTFGKTLLAKNTLIVGDIDSIEKLLKKFHTQIDSGYNISGLVSINGAHKGGVYDGVEVVGSLNELSELIKKKKIQEVIFSTNQLTYNRILGVMSKIGKQRVNFKLVPSDLDVIIGKATIDRIDDVPLLNIDYKLNHFHYRLLKRIFDIIAALVVSTIFLPAFLFKRFFTDAKLINKKIVGHQNKTVELFEFDGDDSSLVNKFPYLWAVLKGDLSFVGSEIVDIHNNSDTTLLNNSELKPGFTGLIQVNRNKQLSLENKQKYQLYYLNNYSPLLDLEIIFKAFLNL